MDRNKITVRIIINILLVIASVNVSAQELIFENKTAKTNDHQNFGPNRRNFLHPFLSSSLMIAASSENAIKTDLPFTGQLALGLRYKVNVVRPLALVVDLGFNNSFFRIGQTSGKSFPDNLEHQMQSVRLQGPFGGIFLRIRLGQRGDYLGNFVDVGCMAQASVRNQLVTMDLIQSSDIKPYLIERTTVSSLENIEPFSFKASIRLGFNRFSILTSYRFSRVLDGSFSKDLPDLEIGIEISPVKY